MWEHKCKLLRGKFVWQLLYPRAIGAFKNKNVKLNIVLNTLYGQITIENARKIALKL